MIGSWVDGAGSWQAPCSRWSRARGSRRRTPGRAPRRVTPPRRPGRSRRAVERVVDGDTFIAVRRGERIRVRLIGGGRPGVGQARRSRRVLRAGGLAGARPAAAGRHRRCARVPGRRPARQYGRDLWDVWLPDGRFVQAMLVRRGAADAWPTGRRSATPTGWPLSTRVATAAGRGLHGGLRSARRDVDSAGDRRRRPSPCSWRRSCWSRASRGGWSTGSGPRHGDAGQDG